LGPTNPHQREIHPKGKKPTDDAQGDDPHMCTYLLKPFLSVSSVIWRTCKVNIELSNTAISVQHFSDVHIKKFHVKIRGGGTHNYRLKADLRWYWKKSCKIRNLP